MEIYRTEEEQVAALKQWLKSNGLSVVAGLVIGLGSVFGWQFWKDWRVEQSMEASKQYQKIIVALRAQDREQASADAEALLEGYSSTAYGAFAALLLAKQDVDAGNLDGAAERLEWILENYSQAQFQQVARLRLIRIHLAREDYAQAEALLSDAMDDGGEFQPNYLELRGDLHVLQGRLDEAREQWRQALDLYGSNELLQLKIDGLGKKPKRGGDGGNSAAS